MPESGTLDYAHDVFLSHHEKFIAFHPHRLARVLAEQHSVADLDVNLDELAVIVFLALADSDDFDLVWLLRSRVWNDDAGGGFLLLVEALDDHAIMQWTDFHSG